MKNLIYVASLCFVFLSCDSEDVEPDYSSFLNSDTPGFIGKIDGSPFNFSFSWSNFSNSSNGSISDSSTIFNLNEDERVLTYSLSKEGSNIIYLPDFCNNNSTYDITFGFDISTPKFNYVIDDIFSSALNLTKKNIGRLEDAFNLSFYFEGNKYCVNDDLGVVEILKTDSFENDDLQIVLVWLVIDNIILTNNENGESINITDGRMLAKFQRF